MKAASALLAALLLVLAGAGPAAAYEPRQFESRAQEQRYQDLLRELRCLVCQNETLADSQADLAQDLRQEIYEKIRAGQSNGEIIDFLVARYGDFVLYRPPVEPRTVLLWSGPFLLLAAALAFLVVQIRRRQRAGAAPALAPQERARAAALLHGESPGRDAS